MSQRRGLGRGLGALIPTGGMPVAAPVEAEQPQAPVVDLRDPAPVTTAPPAQPAPQFEQGAQPEAPQAADATTNGSAPDVPVAEGTAGLVYREIPVDDVVPNPRQPRQVFDEEAIAELVHSITTVGLLQPIVVRPAEAGYELVAGERRLRASRLAGLTEIPALVRHTDDDVMLRDALLENLHRVQLNPLEEAAAYSQLMSDFACTQEELAKRVGRSRPQVANTLRLLKLPPTVQRRVAAGVLSAGHARAILSAGDSDRMEVVAAKVVAEGLSVRAVEELMLVEDPQPTKRRRSPSGGSRTPVEYREAADRLAEHLETRVRIDGSASKGRIVVEFADVTDLARIVDQILP